MRVLTLLIVLSLIAIHELGHLLAAKFAGIPVARFSIGLGPRLLSFKKGGTEYRLSLIPIGGYVLPAIEDKAGFLATPFWKRLLFHAGGAAANIALALLLFPIRDVLSGGLSLSGVFVEPFTQVGGLTWKIVSAIPGCFHSPESLSGIIGVLAVGRKIVAHGVTTTIMFTAALSVNLAIVNLLPIPLLDGGDVAMAVLQKVDHRLTKGYVWAAGVGAVLLIGLMIYITVLDVWRYLC